MKKKVKMSMLFRMAPALVGVTRCLENGKWVWGQDQIDASRATKILWTNTMNGVLRHLMSWMMGDDRDRESKLDHLDQAIARLLFLSTAQKLGLGKDDRGKFTKKEIDAFIEYLNAVGR